MSRSIWATSILILGGNCAEVASLCGCARQLRCEKDGKGKTFYSSAYLIDSRDATRPRKAAHQRRQYFTLNVCCLSLTVFLFFSCASRVKLVDQEIVVKQFNFLQEGITRQEVYDHLGNPRFDYEQGRIITYLMQEDLSGRFEVISFREEGPLYNLVLSFGADNLLLRYSLVRVQ